MSKNQVKKSPAAATATFSNLNNIGLLAIILFMVMVLFANVTRFDFVNYDDPMYITDNPLIKDLSMEGLYNIFTTPVIGMYNPLPFIVYAFTYKMWGLDPKYFHLVNLFFHLVAIVFVYLFVLRLSRRNLSAFIVALLFAIHPMHTSVVVWASQLKTSMYLIFYFGGLMYYLRYVREDLNKKHLYLAFAMQAISSLAKPTAVSFAPMLLLLDYYLGRERSWKLLLEKWPAFSIAIAIGVINVLTHSMFEDNIFETKLIYTWYNQLLITNYSVVFYFQKLIYPRDLSTIYPYPPADAVLPIQYYLSIPVLPLLLLIIKYAGSFRKELIFGVLFFFIAIGVMLRLIPAGDFAFANRYSYLSYTGLFYVIGQFFVYLMDGKFKRLTPYRFYFTTLLVCFVVFYTWRTSVRIRVWENSITLFSDVIKKHPVYYKAYGQLGISRIEKGDYDGAIRDLNTSISINPEYADGYLNRGAIYMEMQEFDKALSDLNEAIRLNPESAAAYNSRGKCKIYFRDYKGAFQDFSEAIDLFPELKEAYMNRAMLSIGFQDSAGALYDAEVARSLGLSKAEEFIFKNTLSRFADSLKDKDRLRYFDNP